MHTVTHGKVQLVFPETTNAEILDCLGQLLNSMALNQLEKGDTHDKEATLPNAEAV